MKQLRAIISGRVQGVGFRQGARTLAQSLHLVGWVRNNADGTVETLVIGEVAALEEYATWLRRGSNDAYVSQVEVEWLDTPNQSFDAFEITY